MMWLVVVNETENGPKAIAKSCALHLLPVMFEIIADYDQLPPGGHLKLVRPLEPPGS